MRAFALLAICAALVLTGRASVAATPADFALHDTPRDLPTLTFQDGEGQMHTLGAFRGRVVLLNIWATWCVSCRREMPTLDRLQAALGGSDFVVIALSIDRAGPAAVRRFYDEIGIRHLALHVDSSGKAARDLGIVGLPTTILVDRDGREFGRLVGPAEWDSQEMIAFLRQRLERRSDAPSPALETKTVGRLPARFGSSVHAR